MLFCVVFTWRVFNPWRQERVTTLKYRNDGDVPVTRPADTGAVEAPASGLAMALFLEPPRYTGRVLRDPFAFRKEKPKPAPKVRRPQRKTPPKPAPKPAERLMEKLSRELSRFKVFGFFESGGDKAVFLERGKQVLVVRKGDRLDGKYLVEEISAKAIRVKAVESGETLHIDMSRF